MIAVPRMPDCDAVLADVSEQQPVRPQFVGVAQFLWLPASTILHPGNRVVRQLAWLAGSGQFSQRRIQAELEKLLNTQHHRAAADMVVSRNGFVGLARSRIQKKGCPKGSSLLLGSRLADGLQLEQILLAELEGTALPWEGNNPLKHKSGQMYRYLENDDLVSLRPLCLGRMQRELAVAIADLLWNAAVANDPSTIRPTGEES